MLNNDLITWGLSESDRVRDLKRVRLFSSWSAAALSRLAAVTQPRNFRDGQTLLRHGDAVHGLCVVVEGALENSLTAGNGRRIVLEVNQPGQLMGLISVVEGGTALFDSVAIRASRVLFVPRDAFLREVESEPSLALEVARLFARRTRMDYERIRTVALDSLRVRVAKIMLYLSRNLAADSVEAATLEMPVTQEMVAGMLGLSRQAIAPVIAQLSLEGVIAKTYRQLTVLDLDALVAIAVEGEGLAQETLSFILGAPPTLFRASD